MKLNVEKRIIITSAVFGVVILLICALIIYPTIMRIRQSTADTAQLREYMEKRSERATNLRAALKKITEIRSSSIRYAPHLFAHDQALDLITTFEDLAMKHKVTERIASSDFDDPKNHLVHVSLIVSGRYTDVLNYLADIENSPYFLTPERVVLSPIPERNAPDNSTGYATLNIDLRLYVD